MSTSSKRAASDGLGDRLPRMPAVPLRERTRVTAFGGLKPGTATAWGIADMKNLSPRRYPALATRLPRELLSSASGSTAGHGMAVVDKDLYLVRGSTLYRIRDALHSSRGTAYVSSMGSVTDTDKCITAYGDYLLIFPDKKYLRISDGTLHPMELDTGVLEGASFRGNYLTLPSGASWTARGFLPGDSIHVINADDVTPAPEGYYVIKELHGLTATLMTTFATPYTGTIRVRREVPSLSMAAVCGSRLFGSDGTAIYIGGEGSPFAFQGSRSDGRGAATLSCNSAGEITACASWQGYMLFFKAASICRVLGNRADSFSLLESPAPGIPAALARTLCEVGGELFYYGDAGAYRYAGISQRPERIGAFAEGIPAVGRGGTDGVVYTVDLGEDDADGVRTWRRYLYRPESGDRYAEEGLDVAFSVPLGGFLCTQTEGGQVWISRSDGRMMGYSTSEATLAGSLHSSVTFHPDHSREPDGCRPVKLYLRATHTAADGGILRVVASPSDGRTGRDAENPVSVRFSLDGTAEAFPRGRVELATFAGEMTDRLLSIPLHLPRCDHVVFALEMTGDWAVDALVFEYEPIRC